MRKTSSLRAVIANRYWKTDDAARVVAALRESGLSGAAFAREYGVHQARLLRWKRRMTEQSAVRFHPVQVVPRTEPVTPSSIELVLARGERLVLRAGFDPMLLRQVLDVLEEQAC